MPGGEARNRWFELTNLKEQVNSLDPAEWSSEMVYDPETSMMEDSISFLLDDRFIELSVSYPFDPDVDDADSADLVDVCDSNGRKSKFRGQVVLAAETGDTVTLHSRLARDLYIIARRRIFAEQVRRARKMTLDLKSTIPVNGDSFSWDVISSPLASGWEYISPEQFAEEGIDLGDGRLLMDESGASALVSRLNECVVVARTEPSGKASLDVYACVANRLYSESLENLEATLLVHAIQRLIEERRLKPLYA